MPARPRALVLYASTHGHTHKIAVRIARGMDAKGLDVRLCAVEDAEAVDPTDFPLVVVGASVHSGHHQHAIERWLTAHRAVLAGRRTAFFSVSLAAAEDSEEARTTVARAIAELRQASGFDPDLVEPIAGALLYREYNVATRVLMRLIARRHGQSSDASADVDYTDWDTVDAFARRVAALAGTGAAPAPTTTA